nr:MAG TPA: hypothetical protein [Caudoviricetes sp.]
MTLERCKTILNLLAWNECKQIPSERFDSPPCAGFLLFPLCASIGLPPAHAGFFIARRQDER